MSARSVSPCKTNMVQRCVRSGQASEAGFILGGQIAGQRHGLHLIYPQGNSTRCYAAATAPSCSALMQLRGLALGVQLVSFSPLEHSDADPSWL
jgi:hypothetical protein